jgi:twinkle protein
VEGEIDALSLSQQTGNKWAVVSVPNGAQGAHKAVARSLEWLETFESVVFMFDSDLAGREAAEKCSLMLSVGKARIATLPLKDANEMLVAGRGAELVSAQWGAKPFRPDGVVLGEDLWEQVSEADDSESFPYPWAGMNDKTYGIRKGELVTLTSGTGIGKSSICREIAHHLIIHDKKVGYIALEESVKRTCLGIMGISLNLPIHIHGNDVGLERLHEAFEATMGTGNCVLYDHFGSMDSDHLIGKIRYMVKALDVEYVFLDHVSIMVSGYEDGDERRRIDSIMTKLRSLVEELGIALILVSHLKRPEGKAHEEGAKTSLAQLRGSAAIGQLSDLVIGFERDQQSEDESDVTTIRVLKNRYSGETGINCTLTYNRETGRLKETSSISHIAKERASYT